ncbi:MAG: hydrogenase maturation protease [Pseudomonadales bacterium]|nr:hydrogenase maturation protease [Pseudomonadales bacterium]
MNAFRARVIGIGHEARGDDAVGLLVVRGLRADPGLPAAVEVHEHDGDGMDLLLMFEDADAVVLVDAVVSGSRAPGTLLRLDARAAPLPARLFAPHSTHLLGVAEAVELARATDRLPAQLTLLGVEAAAFEFGQPLSPAVAAAVPVLLEQLRREFGVRERVVLG